MGLDAANLLVESVIGAAYEVQNSPGPGFLEKVYERALLRELGLLGIRASSQVPFDVCYKGQCVGSYLADILVEGVLVVELKCVERFGNEHVAQCLNYLKASGMQLCLLMNFQRARVEVRRVALSNLLGPAILESGDLCRNRV